MKKTLGVLVLTLSSLVLSAACASSQTDAREGHDDTSGGALPSVSRTKTGPPPVDSGGQDDSSGGALLVLSRAKAGPLQQGFAGHDDISGEASPGVSRAKTESSELLPSGAGKNLRLP